MDEIAWTAELERQIQDAAAAAARVLQIANSDEAPDVITHDSRTANRALRILETRSKKDHHTLISGRYARTTRNRGIPKDSPRYHPTPELGVYIDWVKETPEKQLNEIVE